MSEWNWLPIEQAPHDRPVLIFGGVWWCERGGGSAVQSPVKAQFDDGSAYDYKALVPWVGCWLVCDSCGDAWVECPTHFCELPPPPENHSAQFTQKENGPDGESASC